MKKLLQISFAVIYLFLTTGFTVTLHFCGGEVSDVSIVRTYGDEDPCGCDASACGNSCCTDNISMIKLSDSHKSEVNYIQNSFELVIFFIDAENFLNELNKNYEFHTNNFYSDIGHPKIYLENCSFLI